MILLVKQCVSFIYFLCKESNEKNLLISDSTSSRQDLDQKYIDLAQIWLGTLGVLWPNN